jgi:hypothetical protein
MADRGAIGEVHEVTVGDVQAMNVTPDLAHQVLLPQKIIQGRRPHPFSQRYVTV